MVRSNLAELPRILTEAFALVGLGKISKNTPSAVVLLWVKEGEQVDAEKLYAQIGQLKVENDFLKKSFRKLGI